MKFCFPFFVCMKCFIKKHFYIFCICEMFYKKRLHVELPNHNITITANCCSWNNWRGLLKQKVIPCVINTCIQTIIRNLFQSSSFDSSLCISWTRSKINKGKILWFDFFSFSSAQPVSICTGLLSMFQAELSQNVQMCDS